MSKWQWNFQSGESQLMGFDLETGGASLRKWNNTEALYMESGLPVLLFEELNAAQFRVQAEVLVPEQNGFVGIVFGAIDSKNYESIYICPHDDPDLGEIQYDPCMNGSSTWQIYHGPRYQAAAPFSPGKWTSMRLDISREGVAIYIGSTTVPQLLVDNLKLGSVGRVGLWGFLPSYVRNFSVEEIIFSIKAFSNRLIPPVHKSNFISKWSVSHPYRRLEASEAKPGYIQAEVEENGTLNLNRLFLFEQGDTIEVMGEYDSTEQVIGSIGFGFSDHLKLWINNVFIYEGESKWAPPESDGRIQADFCRRDVLWHKGRNSIRAEITNLEAIYGCGFCMKIEANVK